VQDVATPPPTFSGGHDVPGRENFSLAVEQSRQDGTAVTDCANGGGGFFGTGLTKMQHSDTNNPPHPVMRRVQARHDQASSTKDSCPPKLIDWVRARSLPSADGFCRQAFVPRISSCSAATQS